MKITLEAGTAVLTPTTQEEQTAFAAWRALAPRSLLKYGGRGPDDGVGFWTVKLSANGADLVVKGDSKDDKYEVNGLRNVCFFGKTGGLLYLGWRDGSIVVAGAFCKFCEAPVIDMGSSEWAVCQACADECDHQLEKGFTHSEQVELDCKKFCGVCGRAEAETATPPKAAQ